MLRYGDGTPFSLGDGFLDLVVATVEVCAEMLGAAARFDDERTAADARLREVGEEQQRLAMFERAVVAAATTYGLAEKQAPKHAISTRAADRTVAAMKRVLGQSRTRLKQTSRTTAQPTWQPTARRVYEAAARFFARHELAETRWSWSWDAAERGARSQAIARSAHFDATFELDLTGRWCGPIAIAELARGLVAQLPRPRWMRAPIVREVALDRCALVGARIDADRRELAIRDPSNIVWRIVLAHEQHPMVTLHDRRGRELHTAPVGDEFGALFTAIGRELPVLRTSRRATEIRLDGCSLVEIADTTRVPRALLDAIGPAVREIRKHSRVPGELGIKRDVAAGVREETYVARADLVARYTSLPDTYKRLFDEAGFGRGVTTALDELPVLRAPRATPPPPPEPDQPMRPSQPLVGDTTSAGMVPAPMVTPKRTDRDVTLRRPPLPSIITELPTTTSSADDSLTDITTRPTIRR